MFLFLWWIRMTKPTYIKKKKMFIWGSQFKRLKSPWPSWWGKHDSRYGIEAVAENLHPERPNLDGGGLGSQPQDWLHLQEAHTP